MKVKQRSYYKRFFVLLLLCAYLFSGAQSRNYQFRFLNLPENFSNQYITLLDEDAAGMLWFVTNNGLHRYDGNEVLTFDLQTSPALPDITINSLFADNQNNLWISTAKKLVRFDLKQWTTTVIDLPEKKSAASQNSFLTCYHEEPDGKIFFGSATGQVYCWNKDNFQLVAEADTKQNKETETHAIAVTGICKPSGDDLWYTTSNGQLVRFSLSSSTKKIYYPFGSERSGISFFAFNKAGQCFVFADERGAFLFDTASNKSQPILAPAGLRFSAKETDYPALLNNNKIAFFFGGSNTNENGLGIYDLENGSFNNYTNIYPLSFRTSIFRKIKSKKEKVYISTDRGIGLMGYAYNAFHVALADLQNINSIRTIYRPQKNKLYVSSYKDKFVLYNGEKNKITHLSERMVSSILPWGKDSLLVGTEENFPMWYFLGANVFQPVFQKQTFLLHPGLNRYVVCLSKENDTAVWAGSYKGCYLFNPLTGKIIKDQWQEENKALQESNVSDILKIGNNSFFATAEGVFEYNTISTVTKKLFGNTGSIFINAKFLCLQNVNNTIWAGTNGNGILVFDTSGNIVKNLTVKDGLASNIVFSIPAKNGYVLAGTSKGLSVIQISSGAIANYSSQHYLPSNEFNRAAWFINGDTIFMGTTNGFIHFTVSGLQENVNQFPWQIKLSGVSINHNDRIEEDYTIGYSQNPLLTIPAGTKSFSLKFATLDEAAAEINLFYRFNTDSAWQKIGSKKEITFVNLSPGSYTIQIAAQLPDGQRTKSLLAIPITIQPLFYQTLWFKILLGLAAVVLIVWAIKRREKLLLKEQRLRSRIAGDLHDEVGSALTRIYFQTQMLSNTAKPPDKNDPALEKIADSSQAALSSMSDMVWSIDAVYDNAADMVGRMKDYLFRLQDELDCECLFEVTGDYQKRPLSQRIRQNIFLIFKEAVTNAVKYGQRQSIKIFLVFDKNSMTLSIQNQKAVTPANVATAQGGHGVKSMQLRADKIKAVLQINDGDEGFAVLLKVMQ